MSEKSANHAAFVLAWSLVRFIIDLRCELGAVAKNFSWKLPSDSDLNCVDMVNNMSDAIESQLFELCRDTAPPSCRELTLLSQVWSERANGCAYRGLVASNEDQAALLRFTQYSYEAAVRCLTSCIRQATKAAEAADASESAGATNSPNSANVG